MLKQIPLVALEKICNSSKAVDATILKTVSQRSLIQCHRLIPSYLHMLRLNLRLRFRNASNACGIYPQTVISCADDLDVKPRATEH
jgi:hypothetical protein